MTVALIVICHEFLLTNNTVMGICIVFLIDKAYSRFKYI
jgi:hypothetical protein